MGMGGGGLFFFRAALLQEEVGTKDLVELRISRQKMLRNVPEMSRLVRGLLGRPPGPYPRMNLPPQGSIWHRNRVKSGNRCRINVESIPN